MRMGWVAQKAKRKGLLKADWRRRRFSKVGEGNSLRENVRGFATY